MMWTKFSDGHPTEDCYLIVVSDYLSCETIVCRDGILYDVHMNIYQPPVDYQWIEVIP